MSLSRVVSVGDADGMTTTITADAPDPSTLRGLRRAAGLTQRQLAQRADCSLSWIANAEGGYVPRDGAVLHRVLDVLNDERRPAEAAAVKEPRRQARHDAG